MLNNNDSESATFASVRESIVLLLGSYVMIAMIWNLIWNLVRRQSNAK